MNLNELRILVVEDNDGQRDLLLGMLEAIGVEHIEAASCGRIANGILAGGSFVPDVIITDLRMRDGDGFDVLRAAMRQRKPPQILMTSAAEPEVLARIDTLGATGAGIAIETVAKPIEYARLRALLDKACARSQMAPKKSLPRADIERGLDAGEFDAFLEPQFDLGSGDIVGFEALARWRHPQLGLVEPALFIPVMEQTPLMSKLAVAMFESLLRSRAALLKVSYDGGLSLNIGAECLGDPSFTQSLSRILRAHGLADGSGLTLELTESTAAGNLVDAVSSLARLRMLGFQLALDDFGIGHSSLANMQNGAFSEIKIDRHFTSQILKDRLSRAAVASIISIARSLGWTCVSEGIETDAVRRELLAMGCTVGQGYLASRPLDPQRVVDWLQEWRQGIDRKVTALPNGSHAPAATVEPRGPRFPVLALAQLVQISHRSIPCWLFDLESLSITWANAEALRFWRVDSLQALMARDFGSRLPSGTRARLDAYRSALADGRVLSERWTLLPGGRPITVDCMLTGVIGPNRHVSMLVEAFGGGTLAVDARFEVEATAACGVALVAIAEDGHLLWRNPAAALEFGSDVASFADLLADASAAPALLVGAFASGDLRGEHALRSSTCGGSRYWMQLRVAADSASGGRMLVGSLLPIDTTGGRSSPSPDASVAKAA